MAKQTRIKIVPIAFLVLVTLLVILAVKRRELTVEEAEFGAVREGFNLANTVFRARDEHAVIAFACLAALCGFVLWTAVNAKVEEDGPPAGGQALDTERHGNRQGT
jgi:hypothetical protein